MNPETAYMLVYLRKDQIDSLLEPCTENDIPNWIFEKEANF